MNGAPLKSWTERLLEMAVALVAVGLLLNWAWTLIRPLIPVMVIIGGLGTIGSYLVQRNRGWWPKGHSMWVDLQNFDE